MVMTGKKQRIKVRESERERERKQSLKTGGKVKEPV